MCNILLKVSWILEIPADGGEAKLADGTGVRVHARFVTASCYNRFPIRRHGGSVKLFQCLDSLETLLEALPLHGISRARC